MNSDAWQQELGAMRKASEERGFKLDKRTIAEGIPGRITELTQQPGFQDKLSAVMGTTNATLGQIHEQMSSLVNTQGGFRTASRCSLTC